MKNSADVRGCCPPRLKAEVDNTLLDLQNSSYPTQPHSIIAKYVFSDKYWLRTVGWTAYIYFFSGMDILMDMFPNVDEDDLLVSLKENNFELEEAISDTLIKSTPFGQAGIVQYSHANYLILFHLAWTQSKLFCFRKNRTFNIYLLEAVPLTKQIPAAADKNSLEDLHLVLLLLLCTPYPSQFFSQESRDTEVFQDFCLRL